MNFKEKIQKNRFVITGEIGPPKGTDLAGVYKSADVFKKHVDAVNVTDLQSSVMRLNSLTVSRLLLEKDIEPICQFTTRDRNRLALQSDLLSAYVLGIRNVVVMTGDHPTLGDHPKAKPVYDLDSIKLLDVISRLNKGEDLSGNKLNAPSDLFCGSVVNPGADPIDPEIIKMHKKVKVGAKFFQTQAIFNTEIFLDFMERIKDVKVPIIAGIVLLKSDKMAKYMNENVPGVDVPEPLIKKMEATKDRKKTAIEIAVDTINKIKDKVQGVHLMTIGLDELVPEIVERIRVK
ncbi:MAG: methylenetetrahydrofolate reductase [Candidatus Omnitrophica bacterium]|nr:methylenetetrahydrofolate reductase [Candidatus Omnitrophota bacterium]